MTKQEFRKKVIGGYQDATGDWLDKDSHMYPTLVIKINTMYDKGVTVEEAIDNLDQWVMDNM